MSIESPREALKSEESWEEHHLLVVTPQAEEDSDIHPELDEKPGEYEKYGDDEDEIEC